MKVVFSRHQKSGNVFILPSGSNDIESDAILPRLLSVEGIDDVDLLDLVMMESLHYQQKQSGS